MSEKQRIDRPWREYPIGTLAHAVMGGHWERKLNGWSWNGTGPSFPTPGGDVVSVTLPTPPASQESAGEAQLAHLAERCATLTAELAEARDQRDRLAQENLERAEAVIAQAANARSLADALKKLNNAARISGGVAGADKNLMDACENAERALSLTGTGRAVNAVLDVLEQLRVTDARLHEVAALCAATEQQRDSLRDECERLREDAALVKLLVEHGTWHRFRDGPDDKDAYGVIGIRVPYSTILDCIAMRRDALKAALSASGREGE